MTPAETMPVNEAAKDLRPALKDLPQRWWLMVLLVFAMIFCYGQRNALNVASTSMSADLGFNPAKTGVLFSAFFWVYAFMQMPSGWLVDRFGVRRTYAARLHLLVSHLDFDRAAKWFSSADYIAGFDGHRSGRGFSSQLARRRQLVSGSRTRHRHRTLSGRSQMGGRADLPLWWLVSDAITTGDGFSL